MRFRWLAAVALVAGCGRLSFDAVDRDAPAGDRGPPPEPRVIAVLGATVLHDAAFDAAGNLAIIGDYATEISVAGMSAVAVAGSPDLFVAVIDSAGQATSLWTGGATQFGAGQNLARLPDGSLAASGYFSGTLTRGSNLMAGSRQAALQLRFDPSGLQTFGRHYTSAGNVQIRGLAVTSNRTAIAGVYLGAVDFGAGPLPMAAADNGFVATMDLAGGDVRSRAFIATNDVFVQDLAFAPNGDLCVGGRFNAATDFGAGQVTSTGQSAFVARYDPQLGLQWVRTFGTSASTANVAFLPNGDCVGSGQFASGSIDGNVLVSAGAVDGWIARFGASSGGVVWIRTLSGPGTDGIAALAVEGERIAIAGMFQASSLLAGTASLVSEGATDVVVAGLDLDGTVTWTTQIGGSGDVVLGLGGMAIDATGSLAALALGYTGELRVAGQTSTGGAADGLLVVVPIPRD